MRIVITKTKILVGLTIGLTIAPAPTAPPLA